MTNDVRRALVRFFLLTFVITWGLWLPAVIFQDTIPAGLGLALLVLGGLVPSSTAIALTGVTEGRSGVRHLIGRLLTWRFGRQWWLALFLLPALVTLAALVFAHLGGSAVNFGAPILAALIRFPTMIFPGTALGEEIGWRGYALPRLQTCRSALSASLVLGGFWGLWHLPLYLAAAELRPLSIYPAFLALLVAESVICTWAYNNTRGSLLIAVLFHATANFGLTAFLEPLGSRSTVPFLLYVALTTVAATLVTVASGAAQLSRTHQKHTIPSGPQPAIPATHVRQVVQLPITPN